MIVRRIRNSSDPIIAVHIYLVIQDSMAEAERSVMFLSERTGDLLRTVEEWAIVGDVETAKRNIDQYRQVGAGYFVFSLPHTKDYDSVLDKVAELVGQL